LAPGFIDTHTHDDCALLNTEMSAKASQGVTTVVTGNCGISAAPLTLDGDPPPPLNLLGGSEDFRYFADYLAELRLRRVCLNVCSLIGHSTLRVAVMDRLDRAATTAELGDVQRIMRFPSAMNGSDGLPHDAHPHPRLWGNVSPCAWPLRSRSQAFLDARSH
jgi:N-acyl-D-amino-acid deacylase